MVDGFNFETIHSFVRRSVNETHCFRERERDIDSGESKTFDRTKSSRLDVINFSRLDSIKISEQMPKLLQSIVRENEVISIVYYAESKTVLTLLISLWD